MQLSVIIVNYNVRHFLGQCLLSVQKAMEGIDGEVWVVDNNSVDGSVNMIKNQFPWVKLIENKKNTGFSTANNQAIRESKGKYVLLLNPDTVVEENTFSKCLAFAADHPDLGGLGVKMIDGKGRFLPESKRALPTPWVSFYKIFGLAKLFPRSKKFGRYHLTYLDQNENHEVEILSGAFMLMSREALDKAGLLDEAFFMYGEDIDLSWRLIQAGFKNYYFSETQIIHYKGESTKKGSLNYVRVFYQAMIIFARKHFSSGGQRSFIFMIRMGVWMRALMAVGSRIWQKAFLPVTEALFIYSATFGIKEYWEYAHKLLKDDHPYPAAFDYLANPVYTLVFISFLAVAGAYKRPFRLRPLVTGAGAGFIAIATVSYLFPSINFSRMIVGLASLAVLLIGILLRGLVSLRETGSFFFSDNQRRRILIVGDETEATRITRLIQQELNYPVDIEGVVNVNEAVPSTLPNALGHFDRLDEIVRIFRIDEVVFANKSLSTQRIIQCMAQLGDEAVQYKIVPPDANYLVGPQVIHESLRAQPVHFILSSREIRIKKRLLDVAAGLLLLITFPLHFWLYRRPGHAWVNLLKVVGGKMHLVGYINASPAGLPPMRRGVLNMLHRVKGADQASEDHAQRLDSQYARLYSLELDLEILFKGFRRIGG